MSVAPGGSVTLTIASLNAADVAAIGALPRQQAQALLQADRDAFAALYTEDTVFMPPHHTAVHGRAALKDWLAGFPRVSRVELKTEQVDGRADLAYVRGAYVMTLHPEGALEPVVDIGKFIEIRKRQPDGRWLIAADIFNSDRP
jgi:uncharacterized protein (TIGR02246 family)